MVLPEELCCGKIVTNGNNDSNLIKPFTVKATLVVNNKQQAFNSFNF